MLSPEYHQILSRVVAIIRIILLRDGLVNAMLSYA